jgi:hypothetical protein
MALLLLGMALLNHLRGYSTALSSVAVSIFVLELCVESVGGLCIESVDGFGRL